jgi:hypothetical protein
MRVTQNLTYNMDTVEMKRCIAIRNVQCITVSSLDTIFDPFNVCFGSVLEHFGFDNTVSDCIWPMELKIVKPTYEWAFQYQNGCSRLF